MTTKAQISLDLKLQPTALMAWNSNWGIQHKASFDLRLLISLCLLEQYKDKYECVKVNVFDFLIV